MPKYLVYCQLSWHEEVEADSPEEAGDIAWHTAKEEIEVQVDEVDE